MISLLWTLLLGICVLLAITNLSSPLATDYFANHQTLVTVIASAFICMIWLVGLLSMLLAGRNLGSRQRTERYLSAMLALSDQASEKTEKELIEITLQEIQHLTHSAKAYLRFAPDTGQTRSETIWAPGRQLADFDPTSAMNLHHIWSECLESGQEQVARDASGKYQIAIPLGVGDHVAAILGLADRPQPSSTEDLYLLQLIGSDLWKLILRKRNELALQNNERLLREAQDVAQVGSWEFDHLQKTIRLSDKVFHIYGQQPINGFIPLDSILSYSPVEDQARLKDALFSSHQKTELQLKYRARTPKGDMVLIALKGRTSLAPNGTPRYTIGTMQNISNEFEMETLRQNRADLTALIETTDRVIWSVDPDLNLVISNSRFPQLSAMLFGAVAHPGEKVLPPNVPGTVSLHWHQLYKRAFTGEKFVIESQVTDAQNTQRWMDFSFYPCLDENRLITGVTIFARDFTAQKLAEARQTATMKKLAEMVKRLEAHQRNSTLISRLNELIQSCKNEQEAYEVILLSMTELFPTIGGSLSLSTATEDGALERVLRWGANDKVSLLFNADDCWSLRRGEPHETGNPAGGLQCSHFDSLDQPTAPYLCLPLVVRGDVIGMFHLDYGNKSSAEARIAHRNLALSVCETIKLSLANLRLRVAMREQATQDALTGLFNRHYLTESLDRELHRTKRNANPMTIAMLDIDHFKKFNDDFGHEAGDYVLKVLASTLKSDLRKSDIACRYGGEELCVIMPESNALGAAIRLEATCEKIRSLNLEYRGKTLPGLTVSVGIAEAPSQGNVAIELLHVADIALYAAKKAGRNQICIYTPSMGT